MTDPKIRAERRQAAARSVPLKAALQQRLDRIAREELQAVLEELDLPVLLSKAISRTAGSSRPFIDELRDVLEQFGMQEVQSVQQMEMARILSPGTLRRWRQYRTSFGWQPKKGTGFTSRQLKELEDVGLLETQQRTGGRVYIRAIPQTRSVAARDYKSGLVSSAREIAENTKTEVRDLARRMTEDALGEDPAPSSRQLVSRIRERYKEMSAERASVIARDTMASAANSGRIAGFEATGVQEIEWLAVTSDRRSGDREHWKMNGERVLVGQPFKTPNGNSVRWPHDPTAPISETANCRCSTRPVR